MSATAPAPTILIVDDDEDIREMLGYVLERHHVHVLDSGNGVDALARAHEAANLSLVLLDLRMPGMSGAEVFEHLKRDPETTAIPIVILSGDRDARAMASALGAAGCLVKPVTTEALMREVARFVPVAAG